MTDNWRIELNFWGSFVRLANRLRKRHYEYQSQADSRLTFEGKTDRKVNAGRNKRPQFVK
jgi:hypothetical protein